MIKEAQLAWMLKGGDHGWSIVFNGVKGCQGKCMLIPSDKWWSRVGQQLLLVTRLVKDCQGLLKVDKCGQG